MTSATHTSIRGEAICFRVRTIVFTEINIDYGVTHADNERQAANARHNMLELTRMRDQWNHNLSPNCFIMTFIWLFYALLHARIRRNK